MYQPKVKLIFLQPPFWLNPKIIVGFTGDTVVKNLPANARDAGYMGFILRCVQEPGMSLAPHPTEDVRVREIKPFLYPTTISLKVIIWEKFGWKVDWETEGLFFKHSVSP